MFSTSVLTFVCTFLILFATSTDALEYAPRGFHDPRDRNGSMMVKVADTWPAGLREPLNLIISSNSDARVLNPTQMHGGLYNFFEAFRYGGQCLGLHMGNKQEADLGDGEGFQVQINMLRYQYFGDVYLGTCMQSMYGGGHFRLFQQRTTGAYFLSSSVVKDMRYNHALGPDSYDTNRDYIVGNLTGKRVVRDEISPGVYGSGTVSKRGWEYTTTVEWDRTLLNGNRTMLNHYTSVQKVGANVTDGWTAILTVAVRRAEGK